MSYSYNSSLSRRIFNTFKEDLDDKVLKNISKTTTQKTGQKIIGRSQLVVFEVFPEH